MTGGPARGAAFGAGAWTRALLALLLLLPALAVGAQEAAPRPPLTPVTAAAASPHQALLDLADRWFDELLATHPFFATEIGDHRFDDRFDYSIDPAVRQRLGEAARRCRDELRRIDRDALAADDRLTYDLLARRLEETLAGLAFPDHLLAVSYLVESPPIALAHMASPLGIQPLGTVADYDRFLARLEGFPRWVEVAIANLRRGIAEGVVLPRVVAEPALARIAALAVDDPRESPLYRPVRELPAAFPAAERQRLEKSFRRLLGRRVLPAYRRLRDFLRDDYLPRCRTSLSWSALPGGEAWYRHLVRRETTTDLAPEEVLELGRREVERIVGELAATAERLGHRDLGALYARVRTQEGLYLDGRQAVLAEYAAIGRRVEAALPRLFHRSPAAELTIHAVLPEEEAYSSGEIYMPASPDGSRPGVFYVTVRGPYRRTGMEALYLHEAVPGHHFQLSLAREIAELPRFRRFGGEVAYLEGWALYAETLGAELGLYQDPYQRVGRLESELLRAARLVLDTGIHQGGWTAKEAIDVAYRQTLGAGRGEVVRYAALPAQALAYKVGELRLTALRREAEEALGDSFDPRDFHHQVLRHGPLPLDLLEREVRRWIDARRSPPAPATGTGRAEPEAGGGRP